MVFGKGVFFSVMCRDFLHSCVCLVLHCFLKASSIYSSEEVQTKEVQRLIMKVGSVNLCLLFCQFYYTYETCKHFALQQRKNLCISILISLLKLMRNTSKYHFSGEGVVLNSIMDIDCSMAKGGADQNRMAVDVRGAVKIFSLCGGHK